MHDWLAPLTLHQVVVEATGGAEQLALDTLHAAGLPMVRVNPRLARDFAKATGQLAKTDWLDARALAHMAAVLPLTRYQPLEDWRRQLRAYQQRRMQVGAVVRQQRAQLSTRTDAWVEQRG
ncbi:IS110 family transposase, partial [Xanthomonas perforans]|uniref:IS110 family transposase n=1 Tax=Xanthomonas perforans TaxID=442694 RepID=UPI00115C62EE